MPQGGQRCSCVLIVDFLDCTYILTFILGKGRTSSMPPSSYRNDPIAVVGTACRFPGGSNTPSALWDLLRSPRDCRSEIPKDRFNIEGYYTPSPRQGRITTKHTYFLSDIKSFDAQFFNIPPAEAESIDPQQRLLLETVYEGLEGAGLTIDSLRGSNTSVYVGLMSCDYLDLVQTDVDCMPKYTGSGISRSIDANRISYFFDWNGPSMSIDTACSSSMTALHLAVQGLRAGESNVAVVAGANLIITPPNYVTLSNLKMISPNGESKMWDASANGYARGEGMASIILKTLSAAIADGDPIECVIRETGVNQDGRTRGLTMPSSKAQADLIRKTYERAGLDISNRDDRPQFFEAHGTGTKVGDPREAEAVHEAFFGGREESLDKDDMIHIGSIKTVIGHTEGTAGLAGLLKALLAIKHGEIPPNMHFQNLNPAVAPYARWLRLATALTPWPVLPEGIPRRASVNSFGFGGSNGHAILESYDDTRSRPESNMKEAILTTPFVFSAQSEKSLVSSLRNYAQYLGSKEEFDLRNLAWTLQSKRSTFSVRAAITAANKDGLFRGLNNKLTSAEKGLIGVKPATGSDTRILGIFTGQGAQWAGMAQDILLASPKARDIIQFLDESLATIPREADRPSWKIADELMKSSQASRISEAAISQPLRTAVQILLVDMLYSAGIRFYAVIGHSSGEIGAAYAAGFISASDAIRIAYYRGLYSSSAKDLNAQRGAMMAVGLSAIEAHELCNLPRFQGRISIAACNSSVSVTLSGDADTVQEAKAQLQGESKFGQILEIDTAYHSHHMLPCAQPYLDALKSCDIRLTSPQKDCPAPYWLSSVNPGQALSVQRSDLSAEYWVTNMMQPVQFAAALQTALSISGGKLDAALEIGPHPALQSPVLQTFKDAGFTIPYAGVLSRGRNDITTFSEALGMLWTNCKHGTVDFAAYDRKFFRSTPPSFIRHLPSYPWDHSRAYWFEVRTERARRNRPGPVHPLLGAPYGDETETDVKWRNFLIPKEIPWLFEHRLQGRAVLPGAAYAVMAIEAALRAAQTQEVRLVELHDLVIHRGISLDDKTSGVEIVVALSNIERTRTRKRTCGQTDSADEALTANWTVHSPPTKEPDNLSLVCSGSVCLTLGDPSPDVLPGRVDEDVLPNMVPVDVDEFYDALLQVGYGFTGVFRSILHLQRKTGHSTGLFNPPPPSENPTIHPAVLDIAFQGIAAAVSHPGDDGLRDLNVPIGIGAIRFNPYRSHDDQSRSMSFDTTLDKTSGTGDITIYNDAGSAIFQIEGVVTVPLVKPTEADDRNIFSEEIWAETEPDAAPFMEVTPAPPEGVEHGSGFDAAATCAAKVIKQICHRYPHMNILDIGTGTGEATKIILDRLGSTFKSYTRGDTASAALPSTTQEICVTDNNKVVLKCFDANATAADQGFKEGSYDLVVTSKVIHTTNDISETLSRVRSLLRPGGYLVLLEQTSKLPCFAAVRSTSTPPLSPARWHTMLVRAGFSGIDTVAPPPQSSGSLENSFSVFVSQAVNGRISWLREPLFASIPAEMNMGELLGGLLIVGGTNLETSRLCTGVQIMLSHRFRNIIAVETLEGLNSLVGNEEVPNTVLVLTELEEPVFKDMTSDKLKAIKMLFVDQRCVFWVSRGSQSTGTYRSMTIALGRVARNEQKDLRLQFLDVENGASSAVLDPRRLAEMVLRLRVASLWEQECTIDSILWTTEPELRLTKDNRLLLPRIYQQNEQNNRYKSNKRQISYKISPGTDRVSIAYSESSKGFQLRSEPRSRIDRSSESTVPIRMISSLLSALKLADGQCLFPVVGKRVDTGETVFALSSRNSSFVQVPWNHVASVPGNAAPGQEKALLVRLSWEILAHIIFAALRPGEAVLALGIEPELLHLLRRHAEKQGKFAFAVSTPEDAGVTGFNKDGQAILIQRHELKSLLKAKMPGNVSAFLDISSSGHNVAQGFLHQRLVSVLPAFCQVHTTGTLFSPASTYSTAGQRHESPGIPLSLPELFADVPSDTQESDNSSFAGNPTRTLSEVPQLKPTEEDPFTIIDWVADDTVAVDYEPVDNAISFGADATYLLVGLTGDLGLSLCEWFVNHGARHIALASRDPNKVEKRWLRTIAETGATVKLCAMDVTDKASVQAVYDELQQTMPPIAGVANAAMTLRDKMLSNMELDDFLTIMKPKVDGSQHLHEIFGHNHPLDFFILFSSLSAILGNTGQSNYAAANAFMASLVAQRRAQGLAGSVMHIGLIFGAGYITRTGQFKSHDLAASGLYPLSIPDFHQLFGEAVLASPPNSGRKPEITAGLRSVNSKADSRVLWQSNPKFSHFCKVEDGGRTSSGDFKTSMVPVKAQLVGSTSKEQAGEIIQQCFSAQLADILRLSVADMDHNVPLIQLGVDSLVAVEVRSWFRKQLGVETSVLRILGGASVAGLVSDALEHIKPELLPNVKPDMNEEHRVSVVTESSSEGEGDSIDLLSSTSSVPSMESLDDTISYSQDSHRPPSPGSALNESLMKPTNSS
ncbi:hypothetical protein BDV06DRAFT_218260 [Aspergillus oleicola]